MASRWCVAGADNLQQIKKNVHDEERIIIMDDLVEFVRVRIMENRRFKIRPMELSSHFPLLVAQNYHGAPVVQKIVR